MKRWALLVAFGLCLAACEGSEIVIFSVNQAGMGGMSGNAGASSPPGSPFAGAAGDASAGSPGGGGGAGGSASGGGGAGGGGGAADPLCTSNTDCDPGYFCSKQTCADLQGSCLLTGFPNEMLDLQVCGCDGNTYWNDSYRQQFGVAASTMGPCNSAPHTCIHDQDCGTLPDYRCEHRLPPTEACGPPVGGRCWVMPRHCSAASADESQYQVCSPPNGSGGPNPCVTKCEAIKSGHPFTELSQDQACP